ncbi:MAG: alpha-glucosidase C-terminal domain-containing protein, partial [Bacteroidota bacterium]
YDENSHSGSEYERMGDAAKIFAVLCATCNGVPLIYSGQELPNKKRLKFFDKDVIDWNGNYELHDFYKSLLRLHANNPAMRAGDSSVSTYRPKTTDGRIFSFVRKNGNDEVVVVLNLSPDNVHFKFTDDLASGNFKNIFSGEQTDINQAVEFNLRAWSYYVFEK